MTIIIYYTLDGEERSHLLENTTPRAAREWCEKQVVQYDDRWTFRGASAHREQANG